MRLIVLDTETTGLEVSEGHRIIEIGCIELINRQLTGRSFHRYLNPDRAIDAGAAEVGSVVGVLSLLVQPASSAPSAAAAMSPVRVTVRFTCPPTREAP